MPSQYVTLEEIKDYLLINSDRYDARFSNLIVFASELVDNYCSRKFSAANVTEYHDGGYSILLNRIPVNEVFNVSVYDGSQYVPLSGSSPDGGLANTVNNANYSAGYSFSRDNGRITYAGSGFDLNVNRSVFPSIPNGVMVSYNGGYTDIPYDLRLCVLDIIKMLHKGLEGRSQRQEGESLSAFPYSGGFPPHIRRVLDLYRLVV